MCITLFSFTTFRIYLYIYIYITVSFTERGIFLEQKVHSSCAPVPPNITSAATAAATITATDVCDLNALI